MPMVWHARSFLGPNFLDMTRTCGGSGSSDKSTSTEANQPATAQVWLANNWEKQIDQIVLS